MTTPAKTKPIKKQKSTVDLLLEIAEQAEREAPRADLEKMPRDGGKNLEHYLYGAPKR